MSSGKTINAGNGERITLNQKHGPCCKRLEGVEIPANYGPAARRRCPRFAEARDRRPPIRELGHAPKFSFDEGMRVTARVVPAESGPPKAKIFSEPPQISSNVVFRSMWGIRGTCPCIQSQTWESNCRCHWYALCWHRQLCWRSRTGSPLRSTFPAPSFLKGSQTPRRRSPNTISGPLILLFGAPIVCPPCCSDLHPAQQAALDRLLADQQTPSSPNYHKWLTPEQYADRFGLSSATTSPRWSPGWTVELD